MSGLRQQRTRSRTRFDPGQFPLPRLFQPVTAELTAPDEITLTFAEPIILRGIPPVELVLVGFPVAAAQPDELTVVLTYPGPTANGNHVILRDYTAALRGKWGAWVSAFDMILGQGAGGAIQLEAGLWAAEISFPSSIQVTIPGGYPPGFLPEVFIQDSGIPTSSTVIDPITLRLNYDSPITEFEQAVLLWQDPSLYLGGSRWLAPVLWTVTIGV